MSGGLSVLDIQKTNASHSMLYVNVTKIGSVVVILE